MPKRAIVTAIPDGWAHVRIGNVVKQSGARVKVEAERLYNMTGVKWYGEGVFARETVLGKEMSANYVTPVIPGALIYNRLFAWKGSFAVVPEGFGEQYVSNEFPQFVVDSRRVLPEYLYLYCMTSKVMDAVNRASAGSAAVSRNRLKESAFLNIDFLLPPLDLQRSIVKKWRDARLAAKEALALAEQIEKGAKREFLDRLGLSKTNAIPRRKAFALNWDSLERWSYEFMARATFSGQKAATLFPFHPLGELCVGKSGGTPSKSSAAFWHGDIPWVSPKDMKTSIIFDAQDHIAHLAIETSSAPMIPVGSILIVVRSGILQRTVPIALTSVLVSINQDMRAFTPVSSKILPAYLAEFLTVSTDDLIRLVKYGTTVQSINKEELDAFPVCIPPKEIQQELVDKMTVAHQQAAAARQKAETLKTRAAAEIESTILGDLPN